MLAVNWRTRILKSSTSWRGALPSDCLFGSLFAPLRLRSGQGPGGGSACGSGQAYAACISRTSLLFVDGLGYQRLRVS